jgi:hypothetical protein
MSTEYTILKQVKKSESQNADAKRIKNAMITLGLKVTMFAGGLWQMGCGDVIESNGDCEITSLRNEWVTIDFDGETVFVRPKNSKSTIDIYGA